MSRGKSVSRAAAAIDPRAFRNALSLLPTGVAVIALDVDGQVHAMTANAVSAVSLDPMLVLFCPNKRARLSQLLPSATHFCINFLRDDQQALSTFFAGAWKQPVSPPFKFVPLEQAPRLEGSLASLSCAVEALHEGGDHWLALGRVIAIHQGIEPHQPLLFFKGSYRSLAPSRGSPAPALADVKHEPAFVYYES